MSILSNIKSALLNATDTSPMIKFCCDVPGYEIGQPVRRAMDIKPDWLIEQTKYAERNNSHKFAACPGMHDYYRTGYIISAWEDFEIIVDEQKADIVIGMGGGVACKQFERMDYSVVAGSANIDDDIAPHALKLPCPWKVFTKPGYSAFVMPALFHSPFLRDLFLYPGINDYDAYHTINVMFSPLRKMHVKIYAGTPLLHVIPYKREDITADVGLITQKESGQANFTYRTRAPGFYRKWLHKKKSTYINYKEN
jgi:hypothetical protein